MARNIKVNYIYNTAYQILTLITPFVTTPYLSRIFKADGIGRISFVNSMVQYFIVFAALGINAYGCREMSYLQDDRAARSRLFWNLEIFAIMNVSVWLIIFLVLTYIYADENYIMYLILGVNITNAAYNVSWVFVGMEDFKPLALRSMIVRIVNIALIFVFVKSIDDIPIYLLMGVSFPVLGFIVLYFRLPEYIDPPDFKNIRPFNGLKTIIALFLPSIAVEVYTVLDKTMLGLFTAASFENGYYESAMKIAKMSMAIVLSMSNVMVPRMGYLFGKNDKQTAHEYMYHSLRFVWFMGIPVCLGLIGISDNFVPWFFGDGYIRVAGLLKITSFIVLAIGFNNATGIQYLIPAKMQTAFTLTLTLGATVNFCMNLVFIPLFGSYGAAGASVVAESVIALSQLYVLRKELSFRRIVSLCWNYVIAGIVMLSALVFISKKLAPSPVHTFTMILSGALIYFCVLVVLRDKFFTENAYQFLESIKQKFHR